VAYLSFSVSDGAILGSVGLLVMPPSFQQLENSTPVIGEPVSFLLEDGSPFCGKIESVAVVGKTGPGRFEIIAVTDSDGGGSQLIFAEMESAELLAE
jgi:hypothetical protein